VTELRVDQPLGRLSDPIPRENGYMLCLMLREIPNNVYFEEGRQVSAFSLAADPSGAISLVAVAEACGLSVGYYRERVTLQVMDGCQRPPLLPRRQAALHTLHRLHAAIRVRSMRDECHRHMVRKQPAHLFGRLERRQHR
jgi:hypothetical protein